MSLERKDVRLKISPEAHQHLSAIADLHEKDISEFASLLLERALLGEAHIAKLYAARMARWGKAGSGRDFEGAAGNAPPSQRRGR